MKTFYSDQFPIPLPPDHRFPIEKYSLLRQRILAEEILSEDDLYVPAPATPEQLCLSHAAGYVENVFNGGLSDREMRRIGFPWSPELVIRSRHSVGGTLAACRDALHTGVSANLAGGTHHAHHDYGSGYCVFNDCAVAIRVLQHENLLHQVIVVDCDVHQGDGTAAIFAGDPSVYTFSIHGARNFPFHKVPGNLDIELQDGTSDDEYLQALQAGLLKTLNRFKADLVIYLAGADPYHDDRLGRLALTKKGLAKRDQLVFQACLQTGIPFAIVMAGGYARNITDTVAIHTETIRQAAAQRIPFTILSHAA